MNNPSVIPAFNFNEMVMPSGGKVVTTSLKVAEYFGKAHKNVLRAIKRLEGECSPEFSRLNFEPVEYLDRKGEMRLMYSITKDGWMMLVMGFTGKKAAAIKEAFIKAFNWMREKLMELAHSYQREHNELMLELMKEKDVASMSGRLLNRWGRVKKPQLLARIERLEQRAQITIPGLPQ